MKNKIAEAIFSFLALYLFSCGVAAVVVLGMLLVPVIMATLLVMVIRQTLFAKRKTSKPQQTGAVTIERNITAIIHKMPYNRKAA